ncbi:unnamed protein product [Citrullus colocynthis]|uniref:Peptidase A1 domain-containing protein n=1 Tax=Citrullus colocynthis TaxID=252529 RepID=A0ABP0YB88_9ROSI
MANISLFLFALLFASLPGFLSRSLPPTAKTSVLDVAAAIQRTQQIFVLEPKSSMRDENTVSDSSSLTLQLNSRISVMQTSHSNYKSLTLSRLKRDSARVRSLTARIDLAIRGITGADLEPLGNSGGGSQFGAEDFESPIVSGASQGSGEYFSRVGIGRPPTPVYMVLDTGSDVSWIQCAPCAECYEQTDPIFEPTSSASFTSLSCETEQCKSLDVSECRNGTCLYEVSYGDGSYTVGDFVTETVTLGSTSLRNIALGCGHNNEGLFIGAAGLLGLGGGSLSFPSQLNASSFSYCLVDRDSDSTSTLDFNSPIPPDALIAPLHRNPNLDTFFYLGVTGLSVGGDILPIPETSFQMSQDGNGGIIIDSGTAVTRLQTTVYNVLRDAFVKSTHDLQSARGVALFDTCYDLSSKSRVEVPTVSFHFANGKELPLPAKNYLIPVDSEGTFCFAFAPTDSTLSILGNAQQQGTRVSFDLANSFVGFSPNKC